MMKDGLVRTGLAAALIFVAFALGMLAFTSHALPNEPRCVKPMSMVEGQPGWRILHGDEAREYIELAMVGPAGAMALAMGADAVAYAQMEGDVGIALFRRGCVVLRRVVPLRQHNRALDKILGILT